MLQNIVASVLQGICIFFLINMHSINMCSFQWLLHCANVLVRCFFRHCQILWHIPAISYWSFCWWGCRCPSGEGSKLHAWCFYVSYIGLIEICLWSRPYSLLSGTHTCWHLCLSIYPFESWGNVFLFISLYTPQYPKCAGTWVFHTQTCHL